MARIVLRDYLDQISILVDEGRIDEATAHCRHILEQHPRHVATYELLGKALLEVQRFEEATDLFLRVLSVDPENVISHAGLAIVYSERNDWEKAALHMERAYDIDPNNQAIAAELSELYSKLDGKTPERLSMSRTALARQYIQGAEYDLAASVLLGLIEEQPDRIDLQILLAETYYRAYHHNKAAELAMDIVTQLPLSFKANAILAGVWMAKGQPERASQHFMRVRSVLQPDASYLAEDTLVAKVLSSMDKIKLPKQVTVDELDYIPAARAAVEDQDDSGQAKESDSSGSADMDEWLKEFSRRLD